MKKRVELEKLMKKGKGLLISGVVLIILAVALSVGSYFMFKDELDNPVNFLNVSEEGKYAQIEVDYMTDYFATYEVDSKVDKVYMVFDSDNVGYIVILDEETREKLNDIYEYSYNDVVEEPENVTIYGTTTIIPDDLKDLAIEFYNEIYGEEFVDYSNFNEWLGYYYLDTNIDPISNNVPYIMIITGIMGVLGLCFLFNYLKNNSNSKKVQEKYKEQIERIEEELNSDNVINYEKQKLYLTSNYLVTFNSGLNVIEYSNIIWIYDKDFKYRGNVTKTLYVVTNDSKVHTVVSFNVNKKTTELFNEIYQNIIIKIPNALEGFNKENSEKVKDMYKK